MGLSEIADGLEVTTRQRERGVASVDRTDAPLAERLEPYAADLPCSPAGAATIAQAYASGKSVGAAGHAAGHPPLTAAKALHRLGESVNPLGPTGRKIVGDWIAGELSRTEAKTLADVGETEFLLAAYVETHDPVPGAREAVEGVLTAGDVATRDRRQPLSETMSDPTDLR